MLGIVERVWSTAGVDADRQFATWADLASDAFVPVSISRPDGRPGFASEARGRRVGDLGVSWLASEAQVVDRPAELIARHPGGTYFVNVPLVGQGIAMQEGRSALTRAGDLVLVDADRPFRLEFGGCFEQVSLAVPHAVLDPLLAAPADATAVTVPGDSGPGAVAVAALTALAQQRGRLTAAQSLGLVRHVVGLVALGLAGAQTARCCTRAHLLQAALDAIDAQLTDPDLTIDRVARAACISTSYLTKLFTERGTTFCRFVLGRRLDRALAALDPGLPGPRGTVTDVALACGFRDSSHFARTFRARFGVTPSDRAAGRAAAPARGRAAASDAPDGRGPGCV